MPDSSGAVNLGEKRQEEDKTEEQAQPGTPTRFQTAFGILVGVDGDPQIVSYSHEDIVLNTEPTPDMVFGACATVIKDLQAAETAEAAAKMTAGFLAQQAQAAMQQQQAAQMRASLPTDLRRG